MTTSSISSIDEIPAGQNSFHRETVFTNTGAFQLEVPEPAVPKPAISKPAAPAPNELNEGNLEARLIDGGHAGLMDDCRPVAEILARIGDKWSVLVVMLLSGGPKRFNHMRRVIGGISQRMLTLTLRGLERDGLVSRTEHDSVPPRVDYALTPLGQSLREPINALGMWAYANRGDIEASRQRFDNKTKPELQPNQNE